MCIYAIMIDAMYILLPTEQRGIYVWDRLSVSLLLGEI